VYSRFETNCKGINRPVPDGVAGAIRIWEAVALKNLGNTDQARTTAEKGREMQERFIEKTGDKTFAWVLDWLDEKMTDAK